MVTELFNVETQEIRVRQSFNSNATELQIPRKNLEICHVVSSLPSKKRFEEKK